MFTITSSFTYIIEIKVDGAEKPLKQLGPYQKAEATLKADSIREMLKREGWNLKVQVNPL